MRKKVKPPPITFTASKTSSPTLSPTIEIKNELISNTQKSNPSEILSDKDDEGDEKTMEDHLNSNSLENEKTTTTKKEPTKRLFAKRSDSKEQHCTPFSFSSPSSTKTTPKILLSTSDSGAASNDPNFEVAKTQQKKSDNLAGAGGGGAASLPPSTHPLSSTNFKDLNNNKNCTPKKLSDIPLQSFNQSICSSQYSVAGSQLSLISKVMDKAEKGKSLDESLASNRRLPEPLDEKKIALYAGIIALCVLTVIILGIAAFMFLMT